MTAVDVVAMGKPATVDELCAAIAATAERLTPRVREAARHALDHPNDIALNPVAAVAKSSGIAASAYIRLAQALGFSGYGELLKLFREPLQRGAKSSLRERIRPVGGEQPIRDASDPVDVPRAFSQANAISLDRLRDEAATLPLAAVIRLMRNARMGYVLGLQWSYAVAAYLASTLAVREQVHAACGRRFALTDTVPSPVARDAELVLQVNDAEPRSFRSLVSALRVVQCLAMDIAFAGRRRGAMASAAPGDIDC